MNWTQNKPTQSGWYFWRATTRQADPLCWEAIYLLQDPDFRDGPLEPWESGVVIEWPRGGWWAGPLPTPNQGNDKTR